MSTNIGYFHTSDFASRLYIHERSLPYSFSFHAFYGKGLRGSIFVRTNLNKNLSTIFKIGSTHYFERKRISSGLQQTDSSTLSEMEIQLQWII